MGLFFALTLHLVSVWWKGSETDGGHRCEGCSPEGFTCVRLNSPLFLKNTKNVRSDHLFLGSWCPNTPSCPHSSSVSSSSQFWWPSNLQVFVVSPPAGVVRPTLTILPPSSEELKQDGATLVCLASGGSPSQWSLSWKVGGSSPTTGTSHSLEVPGSDGRFSWSSTLKLSADQWKKVDSVSCEASLCGQSPVTQTLDPHGCSV